MLGLGSKFPAQFPKRSTIAHSDPSHPIKTIEPKQIKSKPNPDQIEPTANQIQVESIQIQIKSSPKQIQLKSNQIADTLSVRDSSARTDNVSNSNSIQIKSKQNRETTYSVVKVQLGLSTNASRAQTMCCPCEAATAPSGTVQHRMENIRSTMEAQLRRAGEWGGAIPRREGRGSMQ